jgi:hypothetical protein
MEIEAGFLDLTTGDESLFNVGAGAQVAGFNFNGGVATARFVVAVFDYFEQVAVEFEGHALAEVIYIDHRFFLIEKCKRAGLYASYRNVARGF